MKSRLLPEESFCLALPRRSLHRGEVVAVGPGKRQDNGEVAPMGVKVGDLVIFGQYGGNEVKIDGDEYLMLSESDIYGIFS